MSRMQDAIKGALAGDTFTVSSTIRVLAEGGILAAQINERMFIDAYCDMNVLHAACKACATSVIAVLLRTPGIALDCPDGEGRTALCILIETARRTPQRHAEAIFNIKELLTYGATFGYKDWSGLHLDETKKEWAPDSHARSCAMCGTGFSFLLRKHHCRGCGLVMCDDCCPFRDEARACDFCWQVTQLWKARILLNNNNK